MEEKMKELLKILDECLEYEGHEITEDIIMIYASSNREEVECPYCGGKTKRIHSRGERRFRDLPIQGKKVEVVMKQRKMFCVNKACKRTTFSERFDFLPSKGKRSKRLTSEIIRVSLTVSSVTASKMLKESVADVGKSTICNLLKKRQADYK